MVTKFDVGDEVFIKVRIKSILKDANGLSYGVNIISRNENVANGFFMMPDKEVFETGKDGNPELFSLVQQIVDGE